MKQQNDSLLPYLNPGGDSSLKVRFVAGGASGAQRSYPFRLMVDSSPYCRILEGWLVTGAGSKVKEVFLQIQKDRYDNGAEGARRVTNLDIDEAWQESAAALSSRDEIIRLSPQLRQAPVFYCREKELFFHPVCPSCGVPLALCGDDSFLRSAGLSPYSTSAKRYLYCRACCNAGMQEIYLYERENADPLLLKDRWALIQRMGSIDGAIDPEGAFPCPRCEEHGSCFGERGEVRLRMIPFSFYPFHMLITSAPSLHSADFLALLSGAKVDELEQMLDPVSEEGRFRRLKEVRAGEGAALFPPDDVRFYLELLFLKLAFLREVLRHSLASRSARIASDRIWIRLTPLAETLPLFWNFAVQVLEDPHPRGAPRLPAEESAELGLFWFQTLVANKTVSAATLLHAVADRLAPRRGHCGSTEAPQRLGELLLPQNLFWNGDFEGFSPEAVPFWERACSLGLQLLDGARGGAVLPREELLQSLTLLSEDLKRALLAPRERRDEEGASAAEPADEAVTETVLLTAPPPEGSAAPDPLGETVVIVPERGARQAGERGGEALNEAPLPAQATAMPPPAVTAEPGAPEPLHGAGGESTEADQLAETVVITKPHQQRTSDFQR